MTAARTRGAPRSIEEQPAAADASLRPDLRATGAALARNGSAAVAAAAAGFGVLLVDALAPGRNPRSNLGDLDGLAASIRAVGVIEPLVVERDPGRPLERWTVIAGHRRLAAARLAGLAEVPCVLREGPSTDAQRLELALVENLQRAGLEPLDEAEGYRTLVGLGLSQRAIAERVGCSQSHVSKRMALLELPAPVRRRVEKGTLPIEAAAALLRLKDHPERLKEVAGLDPSTIAVEVGRAERRIAFEAKLAELAGVARAKGWEVVEEPGWNDKRRSFKTLAHWNGPPELDVGGAAAAHAAEPCHGVMLPSAERFSYGRKPTATSVCLDPARHSAKGASELKAKAPAKRVPSPAENSERMRAKAQNMTAAARRAFIAERLVAACGAGRGRLAPDVSLALQALVTGPRGEDVKALACGLAGLDAGETRWGQKDWKGPLKGLAAAGDDGLRRAALAVALATVEERLLSHYGSWADPDDRVAAHFAFLADLGYEPSHFELAQLEKAEAELAEERRSDVVDIPVGDAL